MCVCVCLSTWFNGSQKSNSQPQLLLTFSSVWSSVHIFPIHFLCRLSSVRHSRRDMFWTTPISTEIQCPPLILAPLVNMSKGGCENKSALFILFIFHSKKITKFQPIIEVKQLKVGGKSHCEINAFSSSCWTQLLAPNYCNVIFPR